MKNFILSILMILLLVSVISIPVGFLLWIWVTGNIGIKICLTGIVTTIFFYHVYSSIDGD
jgi:hypothetical protein